MSWLIASVLSVLYLCLTKNTTTLRKCRRSIVLRVGFFDKLRNQYLEARTLTRQETRLGYAPSLLNNWLLPTSRNFARTYTLSKAVSHPSSWPAYWNHTHFQDIQLARHHPFPNSGLFQSLLTSDPSSSASHYSLGYPNSLPTSEDSNTYLHIHKWSIKVYQHIKVSVSFSPSLIHLLLSGCRNVSRSEV